MESSEGIIRNKFEFLGEIKINTSNKKLMMEKILSYSPTLQNGIEKYKIENRNFTIFILLTVLAIKFPAIALPCCVTSVIFLVKMLSLIKYRSVYNIVKKMGRDIAYKGIYNKTIIEDMMNDFKCKYGDDIIEYYELIYMVKNYEKFVMKLEQAMNAMRNKIENDIENDIYIKYSEKNFDEFNDHEKEEKSVKDNRCKYRENPSLLYRSENGEIRKVKRAIEFFEDKNQNTDAVILKGGKEKNKNITVYLYKKNNELQNNVL